MSMRRAFKTNAPKGFLSFDEKVGVQLNCFGLSNCTNTKRIIVPPKKYKYLVLLFFMRAFY
jgi:hypothetical protein